MSLTASDILGNADTFRRAYPHWPSAEPERPAPVSSLDVGRIATRFVCGLLTAAEAVALLQRAGCTEQEAWDHLARWQEPVTSFTDADHEYAQERADYA
jgi:hypothetical protein